MNTTIPPAGMPFERKWLLGFVDENGELRAMANVDSRQRGALGPPRRRGGQRPGGAILAPRRLSRGSPPSRCRHG
jgi:hypothetical protein